MKTTIFYGSNTGNTEFVASKIAKIFGIETIDIAKNGISALSELDKIIIGVSTFGDGDLQDDWEDVWDDFEKIDFSNKVVAIFGLGDQEGYSDTFLDGANIIYEAVINQGGRIVGHWEISEEYSHRESKAIKDGKFIALAIDEDNQEELTEARVKQWCEQIKSEIL